MQGQACWQKSYTWGITYHFFLLHFFIVWHYDSSVGRAGVQQNGLSPKQSQLLARPIQNEKAELFRSSAFFVLLGFAQTGWSHIYLVPATRPVCTSPEPIDEKEDL